MHRLSNYKVPKLNIHSNYGINYFQTSFAYKKTCTIKKNQFLLLRNWHWNWNFYLSNTFSAIKADLPSFICDQIVCNLREISYSSVNSALVLPKVQRRSQAQL